MQYSTNYNLNLPEGFDQFDIGHFNANTRALDTKIKSIQDVTDNVNFTSKKLTATLTANETKLIFTDPFINSNSCVDVYASVFGVNPKNMTSSGNTVTLTFLPQSSNVDILISVTNWRV